MLTTIIPREATNSITQTSKPARKLVIEFKYGGVWPRKQESIQQVARMLANKEAREQTSKRPQPKQVREQAVICQMHATKDRCMQPRKKESFKTRKYLIARKLSKRVQLYFRIRKQISKFQECVQARKNESNQETSRYSQSLKQEVKQTRNKKIRR